MHKYDENHNVEDNYCNFALLAHTFAYECIAFQNWKSDEFVCYSSAFTSGAPDLSCSLRSHEAVL